LEEKKSHLPKMIDACKDEVIVLRFNRGYNIYKYRVYGKFGKKIGVRKKG